MEETQVTSTASDGGAAEASIDPSWWAPAVVDENGLSRGNECPEVLSLDLARLRAEAQVDAGEDSLRTRVLDVLAKAASPMLVPDNWAEPYAPAMEIGNRRSFVPDDLSKPELELLARLVPLIEEPALRARVADIAWSYGNRGNMDLLSAAVDAYRSVPLERDAWLDAGRDGWRRALELSLRRGKAGRQIVMEMTTELAEFLLAKDGSAGFMLTEISDLLRKVRSVDQAPRDLADHFVSLAATVAGNHRLRRAYERHACTWFSRAGETDLANECIERVALAYIDEADERLAQDRGALVAGMFIEKSIATIRGLPRKYRSARGLDGQLQQLRDRLADMRELSLEEMMLIQSDPIDITPFVEDARKRVSGKERLEALVSLAGIVPLIDATKAMAAARERMQGSVSHLFGSSTFSTDARKVATRAGLGVGEPSDEAVFAEVVRSFTWGIDLHVKAFIYPALEALMLEHRFDIGFLTNICYESPAVPPGHVGLWARGLWHGLSRDFPSAISMLVPQVEQLVRVHLKAHGIFTLFVDENGVETEKGLNTLLEMPESLQLLGPDLTLELRALLCEQLGPNLRNDLAHGLLNDPKSWSAAAVYAWWLCLRLVVVPYYGMLMKAQAENGSAGETTDVERPS
ncbi:DUF4209 domain-containing protein [Micromonospora sp. NPDC005806]|uniref:DUF4209 domain-containing protein n=1 Tax=Micromonospora sp. NPDC005806 TaxID=3364234 RepID=UPI0036B3C20E